MWLEFQQERENFFTKSPTPAPEFTQPPIQSVPEVKGPGHGADHSPSSTAQVENEWFYASTPSCAFMTWTRTTLLPIRKGISSQCSWFWRFRSSGIRFLADW